MNLPRAVSAVLVLLLSACGPKAPKDPFEKVSLNIQVYPDNTPTSVPAAVSLDAGTATTKSNRPVLFTWNNLNTLNKTDSLVTKLEVTRVINGITSTCTMLNAEDEVAGDLTDWAAATTEYTFTVTGAASTRTFGPFTLKVDSAERVITGGANLGDQTNDTITSGGSFFQTRTVDIGGGGYTGPNFNTVLAHPSPRLIDFEAVSTAGALTVISPSDIKTNHVFPLLKNDCGYQTTAFAAYTGPLNPKTAPLTLAELAALPSPTATSLALTQGLKFVYQTSDGKKGLVLVDTLTTGASPVAGLNYSAQQ